MNSECVQALSPLLSEAKSPESLYLKDEGVRVSQSQITKDVPVISFTKDTSAPKSSDVSFKQAFQKCNELNKLGDITVCPNLEHFGKLADGLDSLGHFILGDSEVDMLRDELSISSSPESSPNSTLQSPGSLSPTTPVAHYDTNTQMSLCEQSEAMQLEETFATLNADDINEIVNEISQSLPSPPLSEIPAESSPRKARKTSSNSDAPSSAASQVVATPAGFDAGSAVSSPQFIFTRFGSDVPIFTFSETSDKTTTSVVTTRKIPGTNTTAKVTPANEAQQVTLVVPAAQRKPLKEPSLNHTFPAKSEGAELKVVVQPEDNHRARYMTEGSRGAVKDKSQQAFPVVQLTGVDKPVTLQVFIGTDVGKVKPHGFYQACKVCGKTASQCHEKDIEGTTVIEIPLEPSTDMPMQARIDCVGILKLRNADVEKRIGLARSKKKSTSVRLVFRVNIPREDCTGFRTLQTTSSKICCTQPLGQPEISKKSLKEGEATGGEELFIIGKNFTKGTKVLFQQLNDTAVLWQDQAVLDMELFQPNHIVCTVPPYKDEHIQDSVEVQVLVQSSGRVSDPHSYIYRPAVTVADDDIKMQETVTESQPECVSPEAVKLNKSYTEAILSGKTKDKLQMDAVTSTITPKAPEPEQPQVQNQNMNDALQGLLQQLQVIQEAQRQLSTQTKVKDTKQAPVALQQPQPAVLQQQNIAVQPQTLTLPQLQAWITPSPTVTVQPQQTVQAVAQPATTPDGAQPASAAPMVLALQQPANPAPITTTNSALWNLLTTSITPQPLPVTSLTAYVDGRRPEPVQTASNALERGPLVADRVENVKARGVMAAPLVDGSFAAVVTPQNAIPKSEGIQQDLATLGLPMFTGDDVDQLLNLMVNGGAATS